MLVESLRALALSLPGVTEDFPFGDDVLAMRVGGKIFLLVPLDATPPRCNAKCDPERALELRAEWTGIVPGWHMNKKHWNTVSLDGSVPGPLVQDLVRHSWELVHGSLPRKVRDAIPRD